MIYRTYQPRLARSTTLKELPLSRFVEFLWIREGDNLPEAQSRLLPIGSMELVINLHEDRIPLFDPHTQAERGSTNGTRICGAHSEGFIINNERRVSAMGVHFKPGGHAAFFTLPAGELHNQIVSLEELWKSRATELRERLLEAPSLETRFLVLEQFLLTMLQPPKRHPAVDFALHAFKRSPTPTVKTVTDQVGLSTRHFNQLFRDQVGLTPKLFCRVRRLQHVLSLLAGQDQIDWLDVAFTCGYFDQAHLIHDFRAFAHCTPTEYVAQRGFHPCHIVLPS
ncbi:helix-turn-helix domain-containing protein [Leptolyngbya sp. FACHB-261]|uniref:AraC family transcriptional regulator n=1 Tax=Leptolyngbya sp. FACHB-261 TaxID=2692806 RepID=UPI001682CACF|nr:helix-turn-helix domain-containing protein [Leptolyngbya sp. FACHB-261]MBD2100415.1 AraC family transcriptional regulator [Leptolyngbya sp. FACHB-261]